MTNSLLALHAVLAGWQRHQIRAAQEPKGARKLRMQGEIAVGLVQGVENHDGDRLGKGVREPSVG